MRPQTSYIPSPQHLFNTVCTCTLVACIVFCVRVCFHYIHTTTARPRMYAPKSRNVVREKRGNSYFRFSIHEVRKRSDILSTHDLSKRGSRGFTLSFKQQQIFLSHRATSRILFYIFSFFIMSVFLISLFSFISSFPLSFITRGNPGSAVKRFSPESFFAGNIRGVSSPCSSGFLPFGKNFPTNKKLYDQT